MKLIRKKIKLIVVIGFLTTFLGCNKTDHEKISELINFRWAIFEFYYHDIDKKSITDLLTDEQILSLGFENNDYMWFYKRNKNDRKYINAKYNIAKVNDTLKLTISNSHDKRFNAVYDIYLDTLNEENGYHHLRLTLDSENVLIVAEKMKSKSIKHR